MGVWDDIERELGSGDSGNQRNQPRRRPPPPKRPRRTSCFEPTIYSTLQGGIIGGVFGGVMAGFDCYSHGLRGQMATQHVFRRALSNTVNFGLFLGGYRGTKCVLRNQQPGGNNVVHSSIAGGVGGAVSSLPQSRDPRILGMNALVSAAIMGGLSMVFHT